MDRECKECGSVFEAKNSRAEFCGTPCRMDFNNRRGARGAELYDLVMVLRYERKDRRAFNAMYAMAAAFREQDRKERNGRKSYLHGDDLTARIEKYAKPS